MRYAPAGSWSGRGPFSHGSPNPSSAAKLLAESLGYYKRAIELNPRDNDAKFNYELVNRELKALKDKLTQQQNKRQQGQGQEEKKEQQQKQENQQQQKAGQGQEQEQQQPQSSEGQAQDLKEMSPEEAKMLLEGYRQEEAGQGKLEDTRKGQPTEATKDW